MDQEHLEIVREMFEAWNTHDVASYAQKLHGACLVEWSTAHDAALAYMLGSEVACDAMRTWLRVFPDIHFHVEAMVASSGDHVVTSWVATATRAGRGLEVPGCSVVEFVGEKIIHVWTYWDNDRMLRWLDGSRRLKARREATRF